MNTFLTLTILFVCAILIFVIYKSVLNSFFKTTWFSNLKPGDKILVVIFSEFCECKREATVIKVPEGSYIEASIDDISECLKCAKIKSITSGMNETSCWYNVTQFHKRNVAKIK